MADGGGLAGAVINGVASIGSSLLTNRGNKKAQERARAHDINMWDKTNAYSDPKSQMERLRNAGLNPNMVYGGSSGQTAGQANALPGAKAPEYNMDFGQPMSQYVNIRNTEAQTNNLQTQNGVLQAERNLKNVQAITEATKNTDLEASAEYKKTLTKKALEDIQKSIHDARQSDFEAQYKQLEVERAKNGQFRGDDWKKVLLDIGLDAIYNGSPAPGYPQGGIPRKSNH